jgi:outer membrane protein OmpA-like peptidoglycan-associated protein
LAKTSNDVSPSAAWHALHQTLGNQGVQRLLRAGVIQAKLRVGQPNDSYEQEAEQVADRVMRMPAPAERETPCAACASGESPCPKCLAGKERLVQREAAGSDAHGAGVSVPDSLIHSLGPGQTLDPATRGFMEQRFGHDFSRVRVHTGAASEQSAREVDANAYTVGQDIVFGAGRFAPGTDEGRRLIAHELTHVVQQSGVDAVRVGQSDDKRGLSPIHSYSSTGPASVVQREASLDIALRSPTVTAQVLGSELLDGFELNSHTLTAEHKRRLLALAKRLKQLLREHQFGTVEVTGHTDATGDEGFNDRLGQDRADAVAAFLRGAGVPAMALLAESAGESALRVPTDRREPRNRRVEIRFLPEPPTLPTPEPETAEPPEKPAQIPRPESLCTEHPEICDPITTKPEAMPSCNPTNCSAFGDSFDKLPPDLQLVLTKSFRTNAAAWFEQLEPEDRTALKQIFNRMCRYGVWCHVRLVLKIAAGEAPVLMADNLFDVPGRTPSAYFMSPAGSTLNDALMATGRFCTAYGAGASKHPGQTTLREISGSDSLHVSIGPGEQFDAHIDKYSPVPEHPGGSFCSNDPSPAAVGHIGREVVPEWFREKTGIPGFQVFPEPAPPAPVPEGALGPSPEVARITLRGPRQRHPRPLVPPEAKRVSPDAGVLSEDVVGGIRHAIEEQVSPQALLPSHVRARLTDARKAADRAGPDEEAALRAARDAAEAEATEYTDAHDVAFDLAVGMERARRSEITWVKLHLDHYGNYGGLDGNGRRAIVGEIRRIALTLRKHLPDRAAGVSTLVLIFGSENLAVREEIRLPDE